MPNSPRSLLVRSVVGVGSSGALAAGMLLAAAGPASAQAFTCGSTVTTSVKLTANVNCTSDTTDTGLTVGASGITVNLNGHKILGPGDSANTTGIADSGYSDVTIENGTISNFQTDVSVEGSSGSDLTGIAVQHLITTDKTEEQSTAVYGEYLDGAAITGLSASDPQVGVELDYSQGCDVTGNKMTRPYVGIDDDDGTGDDLSSNTFSAAPFDGIEAEETDGAVIEHNTTTGADAYGVSLFDSTGALVAHNTSNGVYNGVVDEEGMSETITDNTGSGDTYGIYTGDSTDYTVTGNTFNGGQYGMETDFPTTETLSKNTFNDNTENGLYVWTDNETGYSATVSKNTGNDNAFGLYSQIPTSGYGNHASGNSVVNCYNVYCTKKAGADQSAAAPVHGVPAPHPVTPVRR